MRSLIVEDEFTSRMQLKYFLEEYGNCDIAVNGLEAVQAYKLALGEKKPYDLVCLDIKMPGRDGHQVLNDIRSIEESTKPLPGKPARIFMTTAMNNLEHVVDAYFELCDDYLSKPIDKNILVAKLREHKLLE